MTPSIIDLVFGHDTEPPPCPACSGLGMSCVSTAEDPLLCATCGGAGFGSALAPDPTNDPRQLQLRLDLDDELDPDDGDDDFLIVDSNFLSRFRKPLTEAEMDESAAEFGAALMRGLAEFEDGET